MTATQVRITSAEYAESNFDYYELYASQTNHALDDVVANAEFSAAFDGNTFLHANLVEGETWHYWVRTVFDFGDTISALTYLGSIIASGASEGSEGAVSQTSTLNFVIHGGGAVLTTGVKGPLGPYDFDLTLEAVTLLADQSGSVVLDLWADTYGNYPPTVADTITASAKPTLSTAIKSQDTTLTGWTTFIPAGSTIHVNIDSVSTIMWLGVALKYTRTV